MPGSLVGSAAISSTRQMPPKPPGVLGTQASPTRIDPTVGHGSFTTPAFAGVPSLAEIRERARHAAQALSRAVGWNETNSMAAALLGRHCFTLGVVAGMGENLVETVVGAVGLVKTLALAEYWESKHAHTFWESFRANTFYSAIPGGLSIVASMELAARFWPGFDQQAEKAFKEREALIEGISYAFKNPKEVLLKLTKAQESRFKEFMVYQGQHSLAGNYHAGVLFGELLFDLLMVIDLAAGLVALARMVPKIAEFTTDLAKIAREFREAVKLRNAAKESGLVPAGPRLTAEKKAAAGAGAGRGSRGGGSKPTEENIVEKVPKKPPITKEQAFAKIDEVRAQTDGMEPLGDTIPVVGDGRGTVAITDLNGEPIAGVNSSVASEEDLARAADWKKTMSEDYGWKAGKSQALYHAEGQSLMKAYDKAGGNLPEELNMYVDRTSCPNCRTYLPELMDATGVKTLNLYFKDGASMVLQSRPPIGG